MERKYQEVGGVLVSPDKKLKRVEEAEGTSCLAFDSYRLERSCSDDKPRATQAPDRMEKQIMLMGSKCTLARERPIKSRTLCLLSV